MGRAVIASNTSIKNLKRYLNANYVINTTPQVILTTTSTEILDLFLGSKTFISGSASSFVWTIVDIDTGYQYASGTDTDFNFSAGLTGVYHWRMLPNAQLEVHTVANAGTWTIKFTGVSSINSP